MKTLDEVIEAERHCIGIGCRGCPYDIVTYGGSCECNEDVLYYLEKYRENFEARNDQVERYQKAAKDCEGILTDYVALKQYWTEQQENEPLTWDELRQMEGKPVWIETDNVKFWTVVDNFRTICNQECLCCSKGYMCRSTHARGDWQAYRKERK